MPGRKIRRPDMVHRGEGLTHPACKTPAGPSRTALGQALGALLLTVPLLAAAPDDERRLAEARIAAAAALRATETEAAALTGTVEGLAAREHEAGRRLSGHSAALAPLLPLMERLALYPAETLLAVPAPPDRAILGLMVLRGLARHLEAEAAALRAEAAELAAARAATEAALPRLHAAQASQAAQGAELDRQLDMARAGRLRAEDAAAEQARRSAADAARAETLRAALAGIEAERARAEARARDDAARADRQRQDAAAAEAKRRQAALARPAGPGLQETPGPLFAPVAGAVVRGWGERTEAGPSSGVLVRPPPAARVTAPCSGRAAFAGPFRSYGVLLILDCGGGYHFVLSGFERLDIGVGMAVQAGEPVGTMPGWDPRDAGRGAGQRPQLYIELRRDGQPVNPAPFLRAHG